MTPSIARRLEAAEAALRDAAAAFGPQPIAGVMWLETERRRLTVLLGTTQKVHGALALVDWQRAPLAEVFFTHAPGEAYEITVGEKTVTGRLLDKVLTRTGGDALVEAWVDGLHLWREGDAWRSETRPTPTLPGRPAALQTAYRSPLEVTLDAAQQRAVDLPANRHLLLLGEAGFGKTTVALHRLVALRQRHGPGFRAAVLVPTAGLKRLTELMLARRGIDDVEVRTFDDWARKRAHEAFRGLPTRESVDTPSRVLQLKRDRAVSAVLPEYVRERARSTTGRADLLHFFGDTAWLDRVVAASDGRLRASDVTMVVQHARLQFTRPSDLADVTAIDGRTLDDGTSMEDVNSIDAEDYPVLFEVERLRAARARRPPPRAGRYHAVVIDEAQEFAPLELSMLSCALQPGGCLIVAGDAAQQVDDTTDFPGWAEVMKRVGAPSHERVTLEVNYRCPPAVTALARRVAQLPTPDEAVDASCIAWALHAHPLHAAVWLGEALGRLYGAGPEADPLATTALIYRTPEQARAAATRLGWAVPVHLARDGDFLFQPGVTVTSVDEVKGLEFDVVALPDVGDGTWPDTAEVRRALYVALTRASHGLALVAAGDFSPVLGAGAAVRP